MKKEMIQELFNKFEEAVYIYEGIECWSARELQEIFKYTDWRNFQKVMDKAQQACDNAGESIFDHFVETNKMIKLPKGAVKRKSKQLITYFYLNKSLFC